MYAKSPTRVGGMVDWLLWALIKVTSTVSDAFHCCFGRIRSYRGPENCSSIDQEAREQVQGWVCSGQKPV